MILYTGGKTGGHIMPLVKLIQTDNKEGIFVGQEGNLEETICKKHQIKFIGYPRSTSKVSLCTKGYLSLKKKIKEIQIDSIISTGGYVSIPLCLYGILHHIPIYLIEENTVIGKFNEWMYPFCKKMFWAYPPKIMKKKYVVTGLPVQRYKGNLPKVKYDILVIGGSLGSKVLCEAAYQLDNSYKICLIAGKYYSMYKSTSNIKVYPFQEDIYSLILSSKLVIARAGASTTAEVFYLNRPLICIPSQKTMRNHQYYNAMKFQELGACQVYLETEPIDKLKKQVQSILENESVRVNLSCAQKKVVHLDSSEKILEIVRREQK